MTPLILFSGFVLIIILIGFGTFLSSHINNSVELLLFWMLYVITIITVMTIFSSFYINMILKNKTGLVGPKGERGSKGPAGIDGICKAGCRNDICYNIIIKAIEEKIGLLKNNKFTDEEMEIIDYFRLFNNLGIKDKNTGNKIVLTNKQSSINKIKEIINSKEQNEIQEIEKKILSKNSSDILPLLEVVSSTNKKSSFILNNLYIRQMVKRICHSNEFKEVSAIRGAQFLIEYIKDIILVWIVEIYKAGGELYFKTIGADNNFDWRESNPFDEIKKYDLFYWGYPKNTKPKKLFVEQKNKQKYAFDFTDLVKKASNEGFKDYVDTTQDYENIKLSLFEFEKKKNDTNETPDLKTPGFDGPTGDKYNDRVKKLKLFSFK